MPRLQDIIKQHSLTRFITHKRSRKVCHLHSKIKFWPSFDGHWHQIFIFNGQRRAFFKYLNSSEWCDLDYSIANLENIPFGVTYHPALVWINFQILTVRWFFSILQTSHDQRVGLDKRQAKIYLKGSRASFYWDYLLLLWHTQLFSSNFHHEWVVETDPDSGSPRLNGFVLNNSYFICVREHLPVKLDDVLGSCPIQALQFQLIYTLTWTISQASNSFLAVLRTFFESA